MIIISKEVHWYIKIQRLQQCYDVHTTNVQRYWK